MIKCLVCNEWCSEGQFPLHGNLTEVCWDCQDSEDAKKIEKRNEEILSNSDDVARQAEMERAQFENVDKYEEW